jgi:hypothetical protein
MPQHASGVSQQGSPSAQHSVGEVAFVSLGAVPIENKEIAAMIRPPDSFKYMQCSPKNNWNEIQNARTPSSAHGFGTWQAGFNKAKGNGECAEVETHLGELVMAVHRFAKYSLGNHKQT